MKNYLTLLGIALMTMLAPAARAQCVALNDLLAIGADPTALASGKVVTDHLSFEWTYSAPSPVLKEPSWIFTATGSSQPTGLLLVRPQRPGQDVVLKTMDGKCMRDLRSELKARKLISQPVTCPNCEATRYQAPDFDVTLYSQMKGEYPFVAVVHQVPAAAPPAAAVTK